MLNIFNSLLFSNSYIPHGHCYLWQTPLVGLHLVSDALIAIAYFSIPAMLLYFVRKRSDIPFSNVFVLFGAFIVLCGTGHLLDIWTLWHPNYWLSGIERALTALVSCYTALRLVELLPQFLALQTPEQLEVINCELEKQVAERQRTEETLRMIVVGTSSVTGSDFFPALVQNLATALDVAYVFVCETVDDSLQTLHSLALWADGQLADNIEYETADTPCEATLKAKALCTYPQKLQQQFPDVALLRQLGAESYVGVPLLDAKQTVIGILCILDVKPFQIDDRTQALLHVFADRAAAELQRKWAEEEKRQAYEELEFRVQERTAELVSANVALEGEIHERIVAEAALKQSQEHFSKAFHSNPIACCISSLEDGRFVDANPSFLKLFGYTREEVLGQTSSELNIWVDPGDRICLLQALQQQQSVQQDIPFRIRSGEVRQGMSSFEKIELQGKTCLLSMIYDITERRRAEAEQQQQMRLAALRADIGTSLTESESLQDMLSRCASALHTYLDAAFARIWTLNESEQVLVLQASAGLYTHLNGNHSRIAVGQFKIGWIAQHRQPHLTNEVTTDPRISDRDWAMREGMVAFAGYPLLIKERLLGVMAIFARHPLSEQTLSEMASVASAIAIGIDRKLSVEALRKTSQRERAAAMVLQRMRETLNLETIFRTTTDELRQAMRCDRTLIYRFNADWSGQVVAEAVEGPWNAVIPAQAETQRFTQIAVDQADCIVKQLDGTEVLIRDTYLQERAGGLYRHQANYCCVNDIYQQNFDDCYLELLELLQARAYVIVPIFCGNQLWGLLATYQNSEPRQWELAEIQMVVQIGSQLGVTVQQAELFAQIQEQAEQLKRAKEAADLANRAKSEFLANMSHELRTPLNAILGFTQLMQIDTSLTADQHRSIEIINRSGEHLLGLINDVLEMSKIEAGRVVLHETEFDLFELLEGLEDMLRLKAESKGLRLMFDCDAALPQHIRSDENKLRQVLLNLLGNAVKFTERGHVILRVSCDANLTYQSRSAPAPPSYLPIKSSKAQRVALIFEVEDTGTGIAPDELDDLFEAFKQTRSGQNSNEGTGLGLRISQRFVQLMGGEIVVSSEPNVGSCFTFEIQVGVATPQRQTATLSVQVNPTSGAIITPSDCRILIAEDNPVNRLLLNKLLSRLGFQLEEAEDGQKAIAIWQTWQPHLILMDMYMPIVNGYEATRQIRQLEQASGTAHTTKIIALTASAFTEQRDESLNAGCNDFISKPFRRKELMALLSTHLGVQYGELFKGEEAIMPNTTPVETTYTPQPADLSIMPSEWVARLRLSAAQGNDTDCLKLINQIPSDQHVLIQVLTQWIETYQFDQVVQLTQPF